MKSIMAIATGLLVMSLQGAQVVVDVKESAATKQEASNQKPLPSIIKIHQPDQCQLWSKSYTGGRVAAANCPDHDYGFTQNTQGRRTDSAVAFYANNGALLVVEVVSPPAALGLLSKHRKLLSKPIVTKIIKNEMHKKLSLYCGTEMLVSIFYKGSTFTSEVNNLKSDFIIDGKTIAWVNE